MILKQIKGTNSKNFNDFKLSWYETNIIYVIGPNGAGKSTFCKLLLDFLCNITYTFENNKVFNFRDNSFFEQENPFNTYKNSNNIVLDTNSILDIKFKISSKFAQKIAKRYKIEKYKNLIKTWDSINLVNNSICTSKENEKELISFNSKRKKYNFLDEFKFSADLINPNNFSYETSFRYDIYPNLIYELGLQMLYKNSFYKFCAIKTFKNIDLALKDLKRNPEEHLKKIQEKMNLFFNSFSSLKYYTFSIKLENIKNYKSFFMSLDIYSIYNKNKILKYSEYSTGLKTFLSVLLSSYSISNGGLLILDQPELGLQSAAWEELKNLLNQISKEINKKFIIITHSDFIISEVIFNDLYIIENENNKLSINNISNIISQKSSIEYLELIHSIGYEKYYYEKISHNILIVCEGKTDAEYLNKLNLLYNWNLDIHFLPARSGSETIKTANDLIIKTNSLKKIGILIDNDIKNPNKSLLSKLKLNHKFIDIFRLPDKIQEIEDMFSKNDLRKYEISKENKTLSVKRFLNLVENDKPSKETISNFKKLFNNIIKML